MATSIHVQTQKHAQMLNITRQVTEKIPAGFNGLCMVYCTHTTAGITINENADPDVVDDILGELERMVPWDRPQYKHGEGNSAAHLKASLLGFSQMIPVANGKLLLGTWQGIFFCEFDGPRQRRVLLELVSGCTGTGA